MENLNNLAEFLDEGIKLLAIGIAPFILFYISSMIVLSTLHEYPKSQRIKSKEELEIVVKEEAEKLGINYDKIKVNFKDYSNSIFTDTDAECCKEDDVDKINFYGWTTRKIVRHELYHILKKDTGKKVTVPSLLYHALVAEPRAYLYGAFGIKL